MCSASPSAASSCCLGDPPILSESSWGTSNTFLVQKDYWVQGLVLSLGILVGYEDQPREISIRVCTHRWVKPLSGVAEPQGNRHAVPAMSQPQVPSP